MTFKILSLDGGGMRGVISAQILKYIETTIEKNHGQKLHEYFDLIAGTSTGSILAAGIACQKKADDLINLYKIQGTNIFLDYVRQQRKCLPLQIIIPSFGLYPHQDGEDKGLANVLKNQLTYQGKCLSMKDIDKPILLILAYDVLSRNTTWFSNDDPEEWYYKNDIELWEICTASASAPTFFPPYNLLYHRDNSDKQNNGYLPHIDGGASANNPELTAIAHALSMTRKSDQKPIDKKEIAVLSIGTGRTTKPYEYSDISQSGLLQWAMNITDFFLDPSAENTNYISQRIFPAIGNKNYLRLDFDLNEQFEEKRQSNGLRKRLKEPYNEYIYLDKKKKQKISEEIDNAHICDDLIEAAECYLEKGKVFYNNHDTNNNAKNARTKVKVKDAIEDFINSNK